MTVTVNLHDDEHGQALLDFLNNMKYDYYREEECFTLTNEQERQILKREADFASGLTTAKDWEEIKQHLQDVYR